MVAFVDGALSKTEEVFNRVSHALSFTIRCNDGWGDILTISQLTPGRAAEIRDGRLVVMDKAAAELNGEAYLIHSDIIAQCAETMWKSGHPGTVNKAIDNFTFLATDQNSCVPYAVSREFLKSVCAEAAGYGVRHGVAESIDRIMALRNLSLAHCGTLFQQRIFERLTDYRDGRITSFQELGNALIKSNCNFADYHRHAFADAAVELTRTDRAHRIPELCGAIGINTEALHNIYTSLASSQALKVTPTRRDAAMGIVRAVLKKRRIAVPSFVA